MRRNVVTVLVGFLGLVLGATIGFAVGLRQRFVDPVWLEAVGTWAVGVTLLAVILGGSAYFSEEFARRREQRRQADAKRAEEQRLQLAADHVFCDIRIAGKTDMPVGQPRAGVDELEIAVDNRSGSVVTDMVCVALLGDFHWQMEMSSRSTMATLSFVDFRLRGRLGGYVWGIFAPMATSPFP